MWRSRQNVGNPWTGRRLREEAGHRGPELRPHRDSPPSENREGRQVRCFNCFNQVPFILCTMIGFRAPTWLKLVAFHIRCLALIYRISVQALRPYVWVKRRAFASLSKTWKSQGIESLLAVMATYFVYACCQASLKTPGSWSNWTLAVVGLLFVNVICSGLFLKVNDIKTRLSKHKVDKVSSAFVLRPIPDRSSWFARLSWRTTSWSTCRRTRSRTSSTTWRGTPWLPEQSSSKRERPVGTLGILHLWCAFDPASALIPNAD